jgi:phosphohistidine phosphatase SixA
MALSNSGVVAIAAVVGSFIGAGLVNYFYLTNPLLRPGATYPSYLDRTVFQGPNKTVSPFRISAQEIKKGGYILYFRHPQRQKWDSVIAFDIYELATGTNSAEAAYRNAVCLTAQGREEARMIGKIFEIARVPVGQVASSPSCRAHEGAKLAFGKVDMVSLGLVHTPVTNSDNAAAFSAELKRVLSTIAIEDGKNAVVMAHGNTLENNRNLFSEGKQFLAPPALSETGFYVIKRDAEGKLRIVQKFHNLGNFAASAIKLQISM